MHGKSIRDGYGPVWALVCVSTVLCPAATYLPSLPGWFHTNGKDICGLKLSSILYTLSYSH